MRPSLAAQREREILAALEACVADVGIVGLTVQKVADRSGYSRGHVRHYLGNKADQIRALIDVYNERYAGELERRVEAAPVSERRAVVLAELFGPTWLHMRPEDDVVLDHLAAYAAAHPEAGASLRPMYTRIAGVVARSLADVLSASEAESRAGVIVALAYGTSSMTRLGVVDADGARALAHGLLVLAEEPK